MFLYFYVTTYLLIIYPDFNLFWSVCVCTYFYSVFYFALSFVCFWCFFFFKQKTAYEMRISDWSSDVCSSDLRAARHLSRQPRDQADRRRSRCRCQPIAMGRRCVQPGLCQLPADRRRARRSPWPPPDFRPGRGDLHARLCGLRRSEEHTSELQSLMRLSYAVFCLQKKNTTRRHLNHGTKSATTQ